MLTIALLACGRDPAGSDSPADTAVPAVSAHPYEAEEVEDADIAAMQEAIQSSLERLITLHPTPIHDAYAAALHYGGPSCPNESITVDDGTTTAHWQEVCTYPDLDSVFNGPMTTWTWEEGYLSPQTLPTYDHVYQQFHAMQNERWTGFGLNGQTDITSAGGVDFNCSCLAMYGQSTSEDGARMAFVALDGPAHWSGPETEGTWIQEDIQLALSGYAERRKDSRNLYLRGSASGLAEGYGAMLYYLPIQMDPGERCAFFTAQEERSPMIQIRQSGTGHWTGLSLTMTEGTCTACAAEADLCLDLAPLLDWEDLPW